MRPGVPTSRRRSYADRCGLPALHLAVASALASGARSFEAAAVVTAEAEPAGVDVLAAIGEPAVWWSADIG